MTATVDFGIGPHEKRPADREAKKYPCNVCGAEPGEPCREAHRVWGLVATEGVHDDRIASMPHAWER
jgi:hypothetical protein